MGRQLITISDLSGETVTEEDRISIVVREHPKLDGPVRLDAGAWELEPLSGQTTDYVVLEIQAAGGTLRKVVGLDQFAKLFKRDPTEALESAERLNGRRGGEASGTHPKRDPQALHAVRTWARANGWPDLSSKGRIPAEIEAAYQAQAA